MTKQKYIDFEIKKITLNEDNFKVYNKKRNNELLNNFSNKLNNLSSDFRNRIRSFSSNFSTSSLFLKKNDSKININYNKKDFIKENCNTKKNIPFNNTNREKCFITTEYFYRNENENVPFIDEFRIKLVDLNDCLFKIVYILIFNCYGNYKKLIGMSKIYLNQIFLDQSDCSFKKEIFKNYEELYFEDHKSDEFNLHDINSMNVPNSNNLEESNLNGKSILDNTIETKDLNNSSGSVLFSDNPIENPIDNSIDNPIDNSIDNLIDNPSVINNDNSLSSKFKTNMKLTIFSCKDANTFEFYEKEDEKIKLGEISMDIIILEKVIPLKKYKIPTKLQIFIHSLIPYKENMIIDTVFKNIKDLFSGSVIEKIWSVLGSLPTIDYYSNVCGHCCVVDNKEKFENMNKESGSDEKSVVEKQRINKMEDEDGSKSIAKDYTGEDHTGEVHTGELHNGEVQSDGIQNSKSECSINNACGEMFCEHTYDSIDNDSSRYTYEKLQEAISSFGEHPVTWGVKKLRSCDEIKNSKLRSIMERLTINIKDFIGYSLQEEIHLTQFVAFFRKSDPSLENVDTLIISFRGTCDIDSALVDLHCHYDEFKNGYIHAGMYFLAKNFIENSWPKLEKLMKKRNVKNVVTVGYSLGAAVASIVNIMLLDLNKASEVSEDLSDTNNYENLFYSNKSNSFIIPSLSLKRKGSKVVETEIINEENLSQDGCLSSSNSSIDEFYLCRSSQSVSSDGSSSFIKSNSTSTTSFCNSLSFSESSSNENDFYKFDSENIPKNDPKNDLKVDNDDENDDDLINNDDGLVNNEDLINNDGGLVNDDDLIKKDFIKKDFIKNYLIKNNDGLEDDNNDLIRNDDSFNESLKLLKENKKCKFKEKTSQFSSNYKIKTVGFGCPPILSLNIVMENNYDIKLYTYQYDITSRVSFGSVLDLKFLLTSMSNLTQYIGNRKTIFKKIDKIREFIKSGNINPKLYLPGDLYHINKFDGKYKIKKVNWKFYDEILLTGSAGFNHLMHNMTNAFSSNKKLEYCKEKEEKMEENKN